MTSIRLFQALSVAIIAAGWGIAWGSEEGSGPTQTRPLSEVVLFLSEPIRTRLRKEIPILRLLRVLALGFRNAFFP